MTVYARGDVAAVTISREHGGCGITHSRPVQNGAPAQIWELSGCACEDQLRRDPLWSSTIAEIPETPDDVLTREDWEKRGATDQQAVLAAAMASLTGMEIPESLRRLVSGRGRTVGALMECRQGHASPPGSKFCGECGEPMRQPAPDLPVLVKCPAGHGNLPSAKFCAECAAPMAQAALPAPPSTPQAPAKAPEPVKATAPPAEAPAKPRRLRDRRLDELQALARDKGLDDSGTRTDLIGRLKGAA